VAGSNDLGHDFAEDQNNEGDAQCSQHQCGIVFVPNIRNTMTSVSVAAATFNKVLPNKIEPSNLSVFANKLRR
jgi:hypothetical protein